MHDGWVHEHSTPFGRKSIITAMLDLHGTEERNFGLAANPCEWKPELPTPSFSNMMIPILPRD